MERSANGEKPRKTGTTCVITRRELLRWLGFAAVGGCALSSREIFAQAPRLVRRLRKNGSATAGFFTPEQKKTIATLCDLILPADSDSPGAREAGVPDFIDRLIKVSEGATQEVWTKGLADLEQFAQKSHGSSFATLEGAQQERVLSALAENEFHPHSALESFFVEAKRLIAMGYYTSEAGLRKDLKFQGNTYLAQSPRCAEPAR